MKLLVYASQLHANQILKKLGKYIYNHIDGAFDFRYGSNECDVFITVLYQHAVFEGNTKKKRYDSDVEEMTLDLNSATYANKIRVNIIEIDPNKKTIGHDVYLPEVFQDLRYGYEKILKNVRRRIVKEFEDYDFLF